MLEDLNLFDKLDPRIKKPIVEKISAEYFYIVVEKQKTIDELIEFYEREGKKGNVEYMRQKKEKGEKFETIFYLEKATPSQFSQLYKERYNRYSHSIEYANDELFIDYELKKCAEWSNQIKNPSTDFGLMHLWIKYLRERKSKIDKQSSIEKFSEINQSSELLKDFYSSDTYKQIKETNEVISKAIKQSQTNQYKLNALPKDFENEFTKHAKGLTVDAFIPKLETRNVDIVSNLHFDICFALAKLKNQITDKESKRLLISSTHKFIDLIGFESYIETTTIVNTARIKDILFKADKIVALHNVEFPLLEQSINYDNPEVYKSKKMPFFQSAMSLECITIENKKVMYAIDNKKSKQHFFESNDFEIFTSQEFAEKCSELINMITAFFPALKAEYETKRSEAIIKSSDGIKSEKPIQSVEMKNLDNLFTDLSFVEPCIEILREEGIINEGYEYRGNLKTAIVIWFNVLSKKKNLLIAPLPNVKTIATLLSGKFKGLNLSKDGSQIYDENKRAKEKYLNIFNKEIDAVVAKFKTK